MLSRRDFLSAKRHLIVDRRVVQRAAISTLGQRTQAEISIQRTSLLARRVALQASLHVPRDLVMLRARQGYPTVQRVRIEALRQADARFA